MRFFGLPCSRVHALITSTVELIALQTAMHRAEKYLICSHPRFRSGAHLPCFVVLAKSNCSFGLCALAPSRRRETSIQTQRSVSVRHGCCPLGPYFIRFPANPHSPTRAMLHLSSPCVFLNFFFGYCAHSVAVSFRPRSLFSARCHAADRLE
jgi:hypothetical protein